MLHVQTGGRLFGACARSSMHAGLGRSGHRATASYSEAFRGLREQGCRLPRFNAAVWICPVLATRLRRIRTQNFARLGMQRIYLGCSLTTNIRKGRHRDGQVPASAIKRLQSQSTDSAASGAPLTRSNLAATTHQIPMRIILTKSEAAKANKVSIRTIEKWMSTGLLPYIKVNGIVRIPEAEMQQALDGHLVRGRNTRTKGSAK